MKHLYYAIMIYLRVNMQVVLKIKAGEGGRTFGSVSSKEIAAAFLEQHGIELDKKKIQLPEALKCVLGLAMLKRGSWIQTLGD